MRVLKIEYHDLAPPPPLPPHRSYTAPQVKTSVAARSRTIRPSTTSSNSNVSSSSSSSTLTSIYSSSHNRPKVDLDKEFIKRDQGQGAILKLDDVDKYLADQREELTTEHFDILNWWKVNAPRYKILSQIARDVLAVPVSTVASESAFSTSGRVLDSFQSSLSPRMVEAIICLKNWLNAKDDEYEPVVVKQYMDEVEALEDSYEVVTDEGDVIEHPNVSSSTNITSTTLNPEDATSAKVAGVEDNSNGVMNLDDDGDD